MAAISERVKELRKALDLSQTDFGKRFGVGLGVIRNFEYGLTVPSEMQIDIICTTFDVNREWFVSGEGEMFREKSRDDKIFQFVGQVLSNEGDKFKRDIIELLADLSPDDWVSLKVLADKYIKIKEKDEGV